MQNRAGLGPARSASLGVRPPERPALAPSLLAAVCRPRSRRTAERTRHAAIAAVGSFSAVFHVELRQFPHVARVFNLSREELDARFARPWVERHR